MFKCAQPRSIYSFTLTRLSHYSLNEQHNTVLVDGLYSVQDQLKLTKDFDLKLHEPFYSRYDFWNQKTT